jgi:hypothetical protein
MRRALGVGLAFAIIARSHAVCADPGAPQVSRAHFQREDAQLLEDQQRGLGRDNPGPEPAAVAAVPQDPASSIVVTDRTKRATGGVLLGVAAVSAAASVTLFALESSQTADNQGSYDTLLKVFLATTATSGVAGLIFLVSSRSTVQVAPTATPRSVGLAITGRL